MLAATDDDTRTVAARQLAIASYYAPNLDSDVDAVLRAGDDTARAAVVEVFADNVAYLPRRDRSMAVIAGALHDPAKTLRDAAERAFYNLDDERLTDLGAPTIRQGSMRGGCAAGRVGCGGPSSRRGRRRGRRLVV